MVHYKRPRISAPPPPTQQELVQELTTQPPLTLARLMELAPVVLQLQTAQIQQELVEFELRQRRKAEEEELNARTLLDDLLCKVGRIEKLYK